MKKYKIIILVCIFTLLGIFIGRVTKANNVYEENENNQIKKHVDTISMMLETDMKSGNYEMTTRETWPTEGYVFNSTLSKCENGGELSWDDENKRVLMSGNVSDKCYVYFDVELKTLVDYIKQQYTGTQGENGIYYHDSTLANGAGDNSYRYAGSSETTNNYVCFGSENETCPEDNLYRIIGVFENHVKLIKYDYATKELLGEDGDYKGKYTYEKTNYKGNNYDNVATYYWNKSNNTWSNSNLNKVNLNTNFITNIGEEWANKIATTIWKVGGNTWSNIAYSNAKNVYRYEIIYPATNTTDSAKEYTAKIGLMYVSDYGFAAEPSAWTTTLYNYEGSVNDSTIKSLNWMYMGLHEWSICRDASDSYRTIDINATGRVGNPTANYTDDYNGGGVRPTFYLNSDVIYKSGTGKSSDPIRIEI